MKTNKKSIKNVIGNVIPYYPEYRRLCACSRNELLLNGIICTLMENPRNDIPYYRELLTIVSGFVRDLRIAGVSDDRWEIYGAAIISHVKGGFRCYVPYEYEEFVNRDLRELVCNDEVAGAVFRLAESLIVLRNMAEKKERIPSEVAKRSEAARNTVSGPNGFSREKHACLKENGKKCREIETCDHEGMDESSFRRVLEKVDDHMKRNQACREYRILLEKVFGNEDPSDSLDRRGINGLKKMLSELPHRCILFKGELYRVEGFERFSYSSEQIDDIQFGDVDSGIIVRIERADGHGWEKRIRIHDDEDYKTWRQILDEHDLQIPDRDTWELMADLMV